MYAFQLGAIRIPDVKNEKISNELSYHTAIAAKSLVAVPWRVFA